MRKSCPIVLKKRPNCFSFWLCSSNQPTWGSPVPLNESYLVLTAIAWVTVTMFKTFEKCSQHYYGNPDIAVRPSYCFKLKCCEHYSNVQSKWKNNSASCLAQLDRTSPNLLGLQFFNTNRCTIDSYFYSLSWRTFCGKFKCIK